MRLEFACKVIGMQYDSYKVYRRQPTLGGGGRADRQKGLSLFVVLVIVLLSTLLAAWAFRSSIFNQLVVSNDADYQRAFEAAQATLQDAEFDVQFFSRLAGRIFKKRTHFGPMPFPASAWSRSRDLPVPPKESFRKWWAKREKEEASK